MIFVILVVAIWSVLDSASVGIVLLRAFVVAVLLQVGYFVYVLVMVARQSRKPAEAKDASARSDGTAGTADADDLTIGPLSR